MEKSSEEFFNHIRDWAKDTIANKTGALETYNRLALIDEFYEWFEKYCKEVLHKNNGEIVYQEDYDKFRNWWFNK